jgi:hypothetical protein
MDRTLTDHIARHGAALVCGVAALTAAPISHAAGPDLRPQVNEQMRLRSSQVVSLAGVNVEPGRPILAPLPAEIAPHLPGGVGILDLRPHSVRGAGYRVLVQQADGSLEPVAPGPVRTYRGTIIGAPGSTVAASIADDGLHVKIMLPNREVLWLEPLAGVVPGAAHDEYALYRGDDVMSDEEGCGANGAEGGGADGGGGDGGGGDGGGEPAGGGGGAPVYVAELAADADFEYFQDHGSVSAVESRINAIVNAVNIQYERDVAVRHVISAIVVRTAEPDPYTTTDPSGLAYAFRSHWQNNHADIQRDVAQLFTGKNLDGSTIGWAFYNGICGSGGYGVAQSDWTTNFAGVTDLTAHELGHNWGSQHCSCSNPSYTMNSWITSANEFNPSVTVPIIEAFRDSRTCLEIVNGEPGTPPAAPSGLVASSLSTSAIALAWNDNSDNELGFDIERSADGATWQVVAGAGSNVTSHTDDGLPAGTTFSYRVKAHNADGDSAFSNTAAATTDEEQAPLDPPAAPGELAATAVSSSAIEVRWTDRADNEDGFDVERSIEGGAWQLIASLGPDETWLSDGDLPASTSCAYRVLAFNADGDSDWSNVASATTDAPPSTPTLLPLTTYSITKGIPAGGGLVELDGSDDLYLSIDAALQGNKFVTETVITASSPVSQISSLDLSLETAVDQGTVKCAVHLFNFNNNRWTRLGTFTLSSGSDSMTAFADISGPHRFVDHATGEVRVRVDTTARTNQAPNGYRLELDTLRLEIMP